MHLDEHNRSESIKLYRYEVESLMYPIGLNECMQKKQETSTKISYSWANEIESHIRNIIRCS